LNLAAGLIYCDRLDEASILLELLKQSTKESNLQLIYIHVLELSMQVAIKRSEWILATDILQQSQDLTPSGSELHSLYLRKWRTLLDFERGMSTGDRAESEFKSISAEARKVRDWETMRDCHFHLARITRKNHYFNWAYFGSPFESFRARVRKLDWRPEASYLIPSDLQEKATDLPKKILDLSQPSGLKPGSGIHRLLLGLHYDLFKPATIGQLFHYVYPDRYYDPHSSSDCIYQLLTRARKWCRKEEIHLSIDETSRKYILEPGPDLGIRIPADLITRDFSAKGLDLDKLAAEFGERDFTAVEASALLQISTSSVQRLIKIGIEEQRVVRDGRGIYATYRFACKSS
jgi:hypothetical protein